MDNPKPSMIYRFLGKSGLKVSCIGFGNSVNYESLTPESEELNYQCVKKCLELGINYFDTAEIYGHGIAETILGNSLKRLSPLRKDIVISTKLASIGNEQNDAMLSRKHVIEGMEASLKRLQLDYVDIVFAHRYDYETPIEEVCRAFNWLLSHGKAFYWGTSEWTGQQIMEAIECCERHNLIKPIVEQPEYSLLMRENMEVNLVPLIEKYGFGTTVWSPLAGGYLTCKYLNQGVDGRYTSEKLIGVRTSIRKKYTKGDPEVFYKRIKGFEQLANTLKVTPAQLALAWIIKNSDVSACIIGASNPKQIEDNVQCIQMATKWSLNIENQIDEIFKNKPEPLLNWRTMKPTISRREHVVTYAGN
jgi:voltage-dependent potassium channel beta subunit